MEIPGSIWGTSCSSESTIEFYLGAATMGEGPGKWSAPGRDLPFLYMRKFTPGRDCTVEPDLDVWMRFGLVLTDSPSERSNLCHFSDLAKAVSTETLMSMLRQSPGVYLKESKDAKLDKLGCPQ